MCNCPPTIGQIINRRAWLGSQLVSMRTRVQELEKLARKTPPKTLLAERVRVEQAKFALVAARELVAQYEAEYAQLGGSLHKSDPAQRQGDSCPCANPSGSEGER
jgi:small-conductance mechanosensitive channel